VVVFGDQFELDLAAAKLDLRRIGFVNGQAGTVLVVLAQVGDAAGERSDTADLDRQRGRRGRRSGGRRGRLFLAAAHQGDGGDHGQGKGLHGHIHGLTPLSSGGGRSANDKSARGISRTQFCPDSVNEKAAPA
jgi:hypothetical protein